MNVSEYTPTRDQYAYTFGGVASVMRVRPGTALRLWSEDAFNGVLRSVDDLSSAKVDLRYVNPQTGPFYVEGAQPGDTLVLHLVAVEPARDWGAPAAIPFFGGMWSTDRVVTLQDPLPDTTWIYELDRDRATVGFAARHSDHRIELPIEPMLGTVGVAPAGGEARSSLVPDRFGGNMDTPQMRAGSTIFLGVNVAGAMFSIGDGHYRQGDGEACGTAVEGAMTTTLIVELIKGSAPGWPRIEDDTHWMTVGSSRPMEDSWRIANAELVHWVSQLHGLHVMDAYQLCSQIAEVPVANVVDANYSVVVKAAKALLPAADAFGGMHADLCARDSGDVARTNDELRSRGNVTGSVVDVGDGDALRAWVERSAEAFAGLDVVVANVSALAIPDTEENWQTSLNVDVMHTVRLVRAALPHLERSDAASIIAISSVSGRESDFASGPYGTAKTAIVGYIHGLAFQMAEKNIRANTVSPGNTYFEGGVWHSIETGNPALFETAVGLNPTGQMGTPEHVAAPVVFLASPVASRVSGTNLVVDGALTRGVQL